MPRYMFSEVIRPGGGLQKGDGRLDSFYVSSGIHEVPSFQTSSR